MTTHARYSRAHLSIAWSAVLIGSALPELVLGFRYPLELLNWLSITKTAVFVLLLLLTVLIRKMAPLRALITVLLTLQMAMGAFGAIVSSSAWRQGISGIESPFVRAMLDVQFVRVAVTLAVLSVLFVLYRAPKRFYLSPGAMGATALRVVWLGISGASSWNRVGAVLVVVLSFGTLSYLSIAMHPALLALPRVLSMLPLVLLFSTTNALGEEITYRLALLAPAVSVVTSGHATVMSAVYFGLAHYYGVPSGAIGVVMAGFLGWLACRSVLDTKGVAWAFAMHVVQDIWIFWFMAAMFSLHVKQ
jgi:membrane protease YdiL (CAAX protease family)